MKISNSEEADAFIKDLATDPAMQNRWLSLTDQQRAIIIAGLHPSKAQGTNSDITRYMLLAQMTNKPSSTVKDMLEVVQVLSKTKGEGNEGKNIVDAIRLGFEMSTKNRPQGSSPGNVIKETMTLLKPFYDSLSTKDKDLYNQQFEMLKSQIQPLSQQLKEHRELAKIIGFQKSNRCSQLELENVEILKLKKSGGMVDIHIKIPTATMAKLVIAKIIDLIDVDKLLLDQPEKSTSPDNQKRK